MTFDSPIRFCCAADESEAATSGENMMSLILKVSRSQRVRTVVRVKSDKRLSVNGHIIRWKGRKEVKSMEYSQDTFDRNTPFLHVRISTRHSE